MGKNCKPINCNTFNSMATRPRRGIRKGETLPPPTFEQTTTVDKFVVYCPYRKGKLCTNEKETLLKKVY